MLFSYCQYLSFEFDCVHPFKFIPQNILGPGVVVRKNKKRLCGQEFFSGDSEDKKKMFFGSTPQPAIMGILATPPTKATPAKK